MLLQNSAGKIEHRGVVAGCAVLLAICAAAILLLNARYMAKSRQQLEAASSFSGIPISQLRLDRCWPNICSWVTILNARGKPIAGVVVSPSTGEPTELWLPWSSLSDLQVPVPPVQPGALEAYGRMLLRRYFGVTHLVRLTGSTPAGGPQRRLTWTNGTTKYTLLINTFGTVSIYRRRPAEGR